MGGIGSDIRRRIIARRAAGQVTDHVVVEKFTRGAVAGDIGFPESVQAIVVQGLGQPGVLVLSREQVPVSVLGIHHVHDVGIHGRAALRGIQRPGGRIESVGINHPVAENVLDYALPPQLQFVLELKNNT